MIGLFFLWCSSFLLDGLEHEVGDHLIFEVSSAEQCLNKLDQFMDVYFAIDFAHEEMECLLDVLLDDQTHWQEGNHLLSNRILEEAVV